MNSRALCPAPCEYRWTLLGGGGLAQPALCSGVHPLGPVVPRSFCESLFLPDPGPGPGGATSLVAVRMGFGATVLGLGSRVCPH